VLPHPLRLPTRVHFASPVLCDMQQCAQRCLGVHFLADALGAFSVMCKPVSLPASRVGDTWIRAVVGGGSVCTAAAASVLQVPSPSSHLTPRSSPSLLLSPFTSPPCPLSALCLPGPCLLSAPVTVTHRALLASLRVLCACRCCVFIHSQTVIVNVPPGTAGEVDVGSEGYLVMGDIDLDGVPDVVYVLVPRQLSPCHSKCSYPLCPTAFGSLFFTGDVCLFVW
jgi:hypothetical protein